MSDIQETKPFYKTSEFWLHAIGQLLLWVGALPTAGAPPWVKSVVSLALVAGYGLSRGLAKSGTPKAVTVAPPGETTNTGSKHAGFTPPTPEEEQAALSELAPPTSAGVGPVAPGEAFPG
jgi:hypothetical protein